MKFLLTSDGISNTSIHNALVELLGKPIAESTVLCIPTGAYLFPDGAAMATGFICGVVRSPMCELGWKSLGVLELTALPSINKDAWVPLVQEMDALLVYGGDPFYLCYWMRHSGLADVVSSLRREAVYVGLSAGSMVVTADFGETYDRSNPPTGSDKALRLAGFALGCHLDRPSMSDNSLANLEKWAAGVSVPAYLIDDQTAIQVVDGAVDAISEGHWKLFTQD